MKAGKNSGDKRNWTMSFYNGILPKALNLVHILYAYFCVLDACI